MFVFQNIDRLLNLRAGRQRSLAVFEHKCTKEFINQDDTTYV
jgi:hypothetical protein